MILPGICAFSRLWEGRRKGPLVGYSRSSPSCPAAAMMLPSGEKLAPVMAVRPPRSFDFMAITEVFSRFLETSQILIKNSC